MSAIDVRQLIMAEANRQSVPAAIALAVAHRETGTMHWLPNGQVKRGRDGEVGLFQLMPATAAGLGVDPFDVEQNIRGGVSYLRQMYGRYGNWPDALAAYNWGPGRVDDARAGRRAIPSVVQGYVSYVLARAQVQEPALINAGKQTTPQTATLPKITPVQQPATQPDVLRAGVTEEPRAIGPMLALLAAGAIALYFLTPDD